MGVVVLEGGLVWKLHKRGGDFGFGFDVSKKNGSSIWSHQIYISLSYRLRFILLLYTRFGCVTFGQREICENLTQPGKLSPVLRH